MKLFTLLFSAVLFSSIAKSQVQYQAFTDEKHPDEIILKGVIDKYIIKKDTAYAKWYSNSYGFYKPADSIVNAFANAKNKVQFILFGGTWCEDTQFVLPKFFKIQELSNIPDSIVTFFAVNREKKSIAGIAEAFNIKNVPTIIVMKDGKEIARVIEYGKNGKWDEELAQILNPL